MVYRTYQRMQSIAWSPGESIVLGALNLSYVLCV
jgi:hypothetical protein